MQLKGATALVTGASSGIGREAARALAQSGVRLAVSARRAQNLEQLADEVVAAGWSRPAVLPADLSVRGAAKDLAAAAVEALGRVDILVNNAGGGVGGLQWTVGDRDEGRETFEVNFWSPLALIQELVPAMRERGRGAVVNVTSIQQVVTWGGLGHYGATKAALAIATETLRLELTGSGVNVLEVVAGPVDTAMQAEARMVPGAEAALKMVPLGSADTLAKLLVRALERRRKRLVYPRMVGLAYNLPFTARFSTGVMAKRFMKRMSEQDQEMLSSVVRAGSFGDPMAQAARENWERRGTKRR